MKKITTNILTIIGLSLLVSALLCMNEILGLVGLGVVVFCIVLFKDFRSKF